MNEPKRDSEGAEPRPEAAGAELEGAENLVELVLAAHEERLNEQLALPDHIDGIVVGIVQALKAGGEISVSLPGFLHAEALPARALCALSEADIGKEAAILFEGGNTKNPIVMGLFFVGGAQPKRAPVFERKASQATVDGEKLVFSADKEIVLQCGEASITLTRAGKILIRGAYVLTRSSGVNKIQGGSVQIN